MSDATQDVFVSASRDLPATVPVRRALLLATFILAFAAGFLPWDNQASARAAAASGADLTMLLRFMAVLKGGMALGALVLAGWRFGYPTAPRLAAGYMAASAAMALATGLIWQIAPIIVGAGTFHAGLLLFVVLACLDGGGRADMTAAFLARRRRA